MNMRILTTLGFLNPQFKHIPDGGESQGLVRVFLEHLHRERLVVYYQMPFQNLFYLEPVESD